LFENAAFFDKRLQTFMLRVIKDSTRITQVPLTTNYREARVDPRLPFVVYLVVERPAVDTISAYPTDIFRWPLRFTVTNVFRLLRAPGDPRDLVTDLAEQVNNGAHVIGDDLIAFDVLSSQFYPSEFTLMYQLFMTFFISMQGIQIFNCKIGHLASDLYLNLRLMPMLSSVFANNANDIMPLLDLCVVKHLATRAHRIIVRHRNGQDIKPSFLSYNDSMFYVQERMDLLYAQLFRARRFRSLIRNMGKSSLSREFVNTLAGMAMYIQELAWHKKIFAFRVANNEVGQVDVRNLQEQYQQELYELRSHEERLGGQYTMYLPILFMGLRRRYTEFPERAYMERLGNQEIDIDFDNLDLTDILDEAMAVINREEETDGDENAIQEALMYAADEDQIQDDDDDDDDDENEQEDEEEDEETQTNRVQEIFGYAPRQYGNDEDVELP
jgi:hypothetical protein